MPPVRWAGTIYHGLPRDLYSPPATSAPRDYLAFLGRICPEKRPYRAIRIAQGAGLPLKIAAKIDANDIGYFEERIRPLIDTPLVEFVGEIGEADKATFLRGARALLFPIDWPEPFGLVMIEAMACGTPVIAWGHGSVPEIIENGVTGFIVDRVDAAVDAVTRLSQLASCRIRQTFESRFSVERMADCYLNLYRELVQGSMRNNGRTLADHWNLERLPGATLSKRLYASGPTTTFSIGSAQAVRDVPPDRKNSS
jgi:glycosyltransferase involved in cell wall biosynthesis